jgi:hypothetical protein
MSLTNFAGWAVVGDGLFVSGTLSGTKDEARVKGSTAKDTRTSEVVIDLGAPYGAMAALACLITRIQWRRAFHVAVAPFQRACAFAWQSTVKVPWVPSARGQSWSRHFAGTRK